MLNSHAVRAIKNRRAIITQDGDYPEIYKGFRIEYNENLQRYEGRGEVSYVASSWDKLKKLIDDFWAGKDKQSSSKTSDYRGYKVTDQIIKGFMIYKSGKSPNTYYAKNENGEEYEGTMEEIKKKIDAYWMKRDEDVMKQKVRDHGYTVNRIGNYKIIEGAGVDGGWWFAQEYKGKPPLETKKFKTRAQAEEHAIMSTDDSKTKDDKSSFGTKQYTMSELLKKAKQGDLELYGDPKPRQHVQVRFPNGKTEMVWVEDSKTKDGKVEIVEANGLWEVRMDGKLVVSATTKEGAIKEAKKFGLMNWEDSKTKDKSPRWRIKDDKMFKLRTAAKKMKDALVSVRQNMSTKKDEKVLNVTGDSTGAFIKGELETTDDLFYKGVYYKPQELHALLVKEGMTKKMNELTESEKRDRKGNAWPLYESNGGVFAVVN